MKKRLMALATCLLLAMPVQALDSVSGMNGFNWSTPVEEVKQGLIEKGTDEKDISITEENRNLAAFKQKVSSFDCNANYYFDEKGLYFGIYTLTDYHVTENIYIQDYTKLNEVYQEVYGEGVYKEKWIDDFYKDNPNKKAMAVSKGECVITTTWKADDGSQIIHSLTGENYKISHNVYYVSARFYEEDKATNTNGV